MDGFFIKVNQLTQLVLGRALFDPELYKNDILKAIMIEYFRESPEEYIEVVFLYLEHGQVEHRASFTMELEPENWDRLYRVSLNLNNMKFAHVPPSVDGKIQDVYSNTYDRIVLNEAGTNFIHLSVERGIEASP